jgi:hypothetical protein
MASSRRKSGRRRKEEEEEAGGGERRRNRRKCFHILTHPGAHTDVDELKWIAKKGER